MDAGRADEAFRDGHIYRAPDVARALTSAKRAICAANSDYGKFLAVRDGNAELERLGDDGSDAIGELSDFAIGVGLNPDDVQMALAQGLDIFLEERASVTSTNDRASSGAPKSPLEVIQGNWTGITRNIRSPCSPITSCRKESR